MSGRRRASILIAVGTAVALTSWGGAVHRAGTAAARTVAVSLGALVPASGAVVAIPPTPPHSPAPSPYSPPSATSTPTPTPAPVP